MEEQILEIENLLSDTELFSKDTTKFYQLSEQLEKLNKEKDEKETKWLEIDEMISSL